MTKNTSKILKMTKIPLKPKNYQNIPKNQKITKILPKPKKKKTKKLLKPKNDQNTLEI